MDFGPLKKLLLQKAVTHNHQLENLLIIVLAANFPHLKKWVSKLCIMLGRRTSMEILVWHVVLT